MCAALAVPLRRARARSAARVLSPRHRLDEEGQISAPAACAKEYGAFTDTPQHHQHKQHPTETRPAAAQCRRAPEVVHAEVANLAGLVGHAAGARVRAAAVARRRGAVGAGRRGRAGGDARQAGQRGRADLRDLPPDEEAVEQRVQLLALRQLVGRADLRARGLALSGWARAGAPRGGPCRNCPPSSESSACGMQAGRRRGGRGLPGAARRAPGTIAAR